MVTAWKFLDEHSTAVISGFTWPVPDAPGEPGPWVVADDVIPCEQGVHACTIDQLAWWMSAELWQIELAGPVKVEAHKIAAKQGRLVRRAGGWPGAGAELAEWAVWRVRDHAVAALGALGEMDGSRHLAEANDLAALAGATSALVFAQGTPAAIAVAQVRDSLDDVANPILACWDGARAAGHAASATDRSITSYRSAFADERIAQSRWLAERLQLSD